MTTVADIACWMDLQAPLVLSEAWDNTGLLLGDAAASVQRIQTCLTITLASAEEAVERNADLIISHHPLPFKPVSRITADHPVGNLLWRLASNRVSIYSPHTAWDSAEAGINAMIANRLGLHSIKALTPNTDGNQAVGAGRLGTFDTPVTLADFCKLIRQCVPHCRLRGVDCGRLISRVAIACGSGGSLLEGAVRQRCDLFLTGEATFHSCLEAQSAGVSMLLVGHFASEQFAMVELAQRLSRDFPNLQCWSSQQESDPVRDFHEY